VVNVSLLGINFHLDEIDKEGKLHQEKELKGEAEGCFPSITPPLMRIFCLSWFRITNSTEKVTDRTES
jgi:hypothetical protein